MASVSGLSPATSALLNAGPATATKATGTSGVNQNDFMKLLVAQMRYQNPLEPQSGADFTAQLAQFSSLDGINKLNQNISDMLLLQGLGQGTSLIGKSVSYAKDATGTTTAKGTVESVKVDSGKGHVVIGGNSIPLTQIRNIGA